MNDSRSAVFQTVGRSQEPLWVVVGRAGESVRGSESDECYSALSPLVHRLVVETMSAGTTAEETSSLAGVLRHDHTLEWSEVEVYLGTGMTLYESILCIYTL